MRKEEIIKKIVDKTGLNEEEIQVLINERIRELKGLISDEAAIAILAIELGVKLSDDNNGILIETGTTRLDDPCSLVMIIIVIITILVVIIGLSL